MWSARHHQGRRHDMGRPETPRFALVVWPDDSIGCIPLEGVEMAVTHRQAIVIAREDAACFASEAIEPSQSNPNRTGDEGGD